MASAQVLTSIAIIVMSFIIGLMFFYLTSPLSHVERKQQIEEVISLLINFVIFIWIGKIVVRFSIFIEDPLAILAYPSDSSAFYVASLLIVVNIVYKMKRHQFDAESLMRTFVPVFLVSSFVYEFIEMVWQGNVYSWLYLGLLMVLLLLFLVGSNQLSETRMSYLLVLIWTTGQLVLTFIEPFATVFGFIMTQWYLIGLLVLFSGLLIYNRKWVS
ncbi:MAG TPA: hypothetical protein VK044_00390 [Virgibacillus sp.]|nr:hypothetical protein [Virgibacillus sp.]